ncbi:MAG: hypothetical protein ACWGMZ_09925, partial [Thermoguttaceae bacterium]
NRDAEAQLRSSGYVLEWLALSLPEERLPDHRMTAGIAYLVDMLNNGRYYGSLPVLSAREISGAMHALHALAIYNERFFKPLDAQETPTEKSASPATAQRDSEEELR